ncbi:hypothetical protein [Nocardioides endophyticus]|uniref:hypothetical protein n=1 Tax=Nocardioides endophyticus TaxID=1353775 RepID=UPI0031ECD049
MGDLLASASLLVGVAGVVYSVWYPEIKAALAVEIPAYGRDPFKKQVDAALWGRALPITAVVVALTVVLIPPAWDVVTTTADAVQADHHKYDPVAACFVVVFLALVVLSVACARDLGKLVGIRRDLSKPVQ